MTHEAKRCTGACCEHELQREKNSARGTCVAWAAEAGSRSLNDWCSPVPREKARRWRWRVAGVSACAFSSFLEFLGCLDNFCHKANIIRLNHRCPTSLPSTSLLQPCQLSGELHKTSKGISMNHSTSTCQSPFRGCC